MTNPRVNYDQIAPEYDARFSSDGLTGTGKALLELTRALNAKRIVEVACGTGYWLAALYPNARELCGLDRSLGMLSQAQKRKLPIKLVGGLAERLPFDNGSFDLLFCVNAIHLFDDPRMFVNEAYRVLEAGSTLAIIGADLHGGKDSWYGFHFFDGTYETDLRRFPAWATVSEWLAAVGFEKIELQQVERIVEEKRGREVLADPFLRKTGCSRLALLSDEAYAAGMRKIESALAQAKARGETITFRTDILISMLTGHKTK